MNADVGNWPAVQSLTYFNYEIFYVLINFMGFSGRRLNINSQLIVGLRDICNVQTTQCSTLTIDAGRERSDLVPQPPLLSPLAVVNKNLSRLSRQFLGDLPGDGLNVQGSFLRAEFKWVVAVVRLECHPLLGGVQGSVVADDVAQVAQSNKGVGSVGQTLGLVSVLAVGVEKSVSELETFELLPDDAGKGWTDSSTTDVDLRDSANHQVDVFNFLINLLELQPELLLLLAGPLAPGGEGSQAASLPVVVVAGQAVVAATLDVDGQQVFTEIFPIVILLKQVVRHLGGEIGIAGLGHL